MEEVEVDNGEKIPKKVFEDNNSLILNLSAGEYTFINCDKDHLYILPYRGTGHYDITIKDSNISSVYIEGCKELEVRNCEIGDLNVKAAQVIIDTLEIGEAGINSHSSEMKIDNVKGDYCSSLFTFRKSMNVYISNIDVDYVEQVFNLNKCHYIHSYDLDINFCDEFMYFPSDYEVNLVSEMLIKENKIGNFNSLTNVPKVFDEKNITIKDSPSIQSFNALRDI